MVRCNNCGSSSTIRTSGTSINHVRRYSCAKRGLNCGTIDWYDPSMCERAMQIILGLLNSMNNLQDQVHQGLNSMNNLQAQLHDKSVEAGRVKKMLVLSWSFFVVYLVLS
nr:hypothetical protein [Tanacetum cinerariifolium]